VVLWGPDEICTVKADNEVEIAVLKNNGWSYLHTFTNRETDHEVEIWAKNLM